MRFHVRVFVPVLMVFVAGSGCSSIRQAVMGNMSESLASNAALSFSRESDPVLAAEAMPFALKTLDMLALQQPEAPAVQLAAAKAYIQYSSAFLDWEARKRENDDYAAAEKLRKRATKLFLRGRDYAASSLALSHPDPIARIKTDADTYLAAMTHTDVPALYWLGAGWASAIAIQPDNMEQMSYLPLVEKVMRRAITLDPDFDHGALHEFFLLYDGSRSPAMGGDAARAEEHFKNAITASEGKLASPYVSLATSVAVQQQDAARFRALLEAARAIDPDLNPEARLANAIAQEKALWYLQHIDDLFILDDEETP